jgi:hypothetical protein
LDDGKFSSLWASSATVCSLKASRTGQAALMLSLRIAPSLAISAVPSPPPLLRPWGRLTRLSASSHTISPQRHAMGLLLLLDYLTRMACHGTPPTFGLSHHNSMPCWDSSYFRTQFLYPCRCQQQVVSDSYYLCAFDGSPGNYIEEKCRSLVHKVPAPFLSDPCHAGLQACPLAPQALWGAHQGHLLGVDPFHRTGSKSPSAATNTEHENNSSKPMSSSQTRIEL